jgi:gliding motility-associated-like protein
MKQFLTTVFLFCCCAALKAQQPDYLLKENSVWIFGQKAGVNFNVNAPLPTTISSSIKGVSGEAAASVCDTNGNLLFYTEGSIVWNANGSVMPNGTYLADTNKVSYDLTFTATTSTSQGAVILPVLNNINQYYLFSLTSIEFGNGYLFYSIIDRTLDNGLGDVVPGKKAICIDSNLSEKMVAVAGTHCDLWLLVHATGAATIKAYNITYNGINPVPVISNVGNFTSSEAYISGHMEVSPNRKKLAICSDGSLAVSSGSELCDFDPATGIVSNPILLTPGGTFTSAPYGACFSPDNSKLYIQDYYKTNITQYDLTQPANLIPGSAVTFSDVYLADLKLGPDGKIYMINANGNALNCIASPNLAGLACNYTTNVLSLYPHNATSGLHSVFVKPIPSDSNMYVAHADTGICAPLDSVIFTGPAGYSSYLWSNGDTSAALVADSAGVYILRSESSCATRYDTFGVKQIDSTLYVTHPDTVLCSLSASVILAAPAGYSSYLWSNGSTDSTLTAQNSGTYILRSGGSCITRFDTFGVKKVDVSFTLGPDTAICTLTPVTLTVPIAGVDYLWQDGSTNSTYTVVSSGTYSVTVKELQCTSSDTINVALLDLHQNLGADVTVCNNQAIQLTLQANAPEGAAVMWSNGSTAAAISVQDTGRYWVKVTEDGCQGSDTLTVSQQICECLVSMPNAFSPNGDNKNDLFRAIAAPDCPITDYTLSVYNRWGELVFTTDDPQAGWNGTFHNTPAEVGTYMYSLVFKAGTKGLVRHQTGDVTLVR